MSKVTRMEPNTDYESLNREFDNKVQRHKLGRVYAVFLITVLVVIILATYTLYEKKKIYKTYEKVSTVSRQNVSGAGIAEIDGNLLTYSKDGANCMDAKGNLLWNMTFDMQNPLVSVSGGSAAFADYGGSMIYLRNSNGEVCEIDTKLPIRKISVSEKGTVAAVLEDTSVTWIYLYDINSDVIAYFRTTMEKSGYPLDISLSPNGEIVGVSYYFMDGVEARSTVAFYNFGEVGKNNIDNYVSGYNYPDKPVPMVRFMDGDSAYAVSTARLSLYGGSNKPVSEAELIMNDEIISVFYNDAHIAMIFKEKNGEHKYRLEMYSDKGKKECTYSFDYDYTAVSFSRDTFTVYGNTNMYISTFGGEIKYQGEYTEPIYLVIPTESSSKYYLVTENGIDTVNFD